MPENIDAIERKKRARIMASGGVSDEAREFMLEVASCDERLGEDGMCACARYHFEQIAEAVASAREGL